MNFLLVVEVSDGRRSILKLEVRFVLREKPFRVSSLYLHNKVTFVLYENRLLVNCSKWNFIELFLQIMIQMSMISDLK